MGQPEWEPANLIEQAIAAALASGDGPAYARQLEAARLLLPELPAAGTEAAVVAEELLPDGVPCLPVFTSQESLTWGFGGLISWYEEITMAALRQRWPSPACQLAVNPGCPIATYLTMDDLADLAAGREALVSIAELQQAVAAQAFPDIRRNCLRELSSQEPTGDPAHLRDDPPANALERALHEAVSRQDGPAYVNALLEQGPVVLLTAKPVTDPELIYDDDFPWRVLDPDQARAIPVFSSREMLLRTGIQDSPRVEIHFLDVLAAWPGEDHLLCVNPGSTLELMLPGEAVLEVVGEIAAALEDSKQVR